MISFVASRTPSTYPTPNAKGEQPANFQPTNLKPATYPTPNAKGNLGQKATRFAAKRDFVHRVQPANFQPANFQR
ncbi:hypothetical protein [Moorena sp. SIO4G3]|uniref:hypothetical protein n=1 Tax=Moorena sp. SIO4G3 TaxID=2607821 RepID=UPI0014293FF2|nr:hypothetical protein [Moorena sp. SIO4G3]NEO79137.1 hypothetical protein [Moorena sp. SIO4G3]